MRHRTYRYWFAVLACPAVFAAAASACQDDASSPTGASPALEAGAFDGLAPDRTIPPEQDSSVADAVVADAADAAVFATYLYVPDYNDGKIYGFAVDTATGALTAVPSSPFTIGLKNWQINARDGIPALFAVSDMPGSSLRSYMIDPATGSLTPAPGSPYPVARMNTYGAVSDPLGHFLYVNAPNLANTVSVYAVNPTTRALVELDASPFPGVSGSLAGTAMHPQGKYLYVVSAENDSIHVLAVDASTGGVAEIPASPFLTGPEGGTYMNNPQFALSDQAGKHLYVANYKAAQVVAFDIAPDGGALSTDDASVADSGTSACGIAIDPAGKLLYVGATSTIHGYLINPTTGRLTPAAGSPFSIADSYICGLVFSADGHYLYGGEGTGDASPGHVVVYEVNATTGALTPKPSLAKPIVSDSPGLVAITTLRKQ